MTVDSHDSSNYGSDHAPEATVKITPSSTPPGSIVDEFGKSYPHAESSDEPKEKPNSLWERLKRTKGLNIGLTAIITLSTIVQTYNTIRNNNSSSIQADKLIKAAQMSAHSAAHNAAAAQSFAASAESINKGVQDAVLNLNLQASATKQLADEALVQAKSSKASAEVSRLAFEAESRPYVSVNRILVGRDISKHSFEFAPVIANVGRIPAVNVSYDMKGFINGKIEPRIAFDRKTIINVEQGETNTYMNAIEGEYAVSIANGSTAFKIRVTIGYQWRNQQEKSCTEWQYDQTLNRFLDLGTVVCGPE